MKKLLLVLFVFIAVAMHAQEVEIYYPSFQYTDGTQGITKFNVEVGYDETALWQTLQDNWPTNLGYIPSAEQRALRCVGYGKGTEAYGITDTYAVVDAVDLSVVPAGKDVKATFWTKAQYAGGDNIAMLKLMLTTNFSGDPITTTWTDVTSQLDQIDQAEGYDGEFTKSTLNLNNWRNETAVVLAFRYQILQSGEVNTTVDPKIRPGRWDVCELKFSYADAATALNNIEQHNKEYFFPNPVNDIISLNKEVRKIDLYNMSGELVLTRGNSPNEVELSSLSSGVYIAKLVLDQGTIVSKKLIIRH